MCPVPGRTTNKAESEVNLPYLTVSASTYILEQNLGHEWEASWKENCIFFTCLVRVIYALFHVLVSLKHSMWFKLLFCVLSNKVKNIFELFVPV